MILNDIRLLVGMAVADKGYPPSIIAPVLNILNLVDAHLAAIGINMPEEVYKEADRLAHAIVLHNASDDFDMDDDDDDDENDFEEEDIEEETEEEDYDDDDDDAF